GSAPRVVLLALVRRPGARLPGWWFKGTVDRVADRQSASRRGSWLWPALVVAALLGASATLGGVAGATVIENYDGLPSMMNPSAALSCCTGTLLIMVSPLAWWFMRELNRDR